jgi:hypothetical protein
MSDEKVKGTMMADQVRMIRANKDKDWNKYLKSEDWNIIKGMVLPSAWYPLDTYKRCGRATFQVLAGGNTDLVRLRGRIRGKELFESTYKHIISDRNPMNALSSFVNLYGHLFNFSPLEFKKIDAKHACILYSYRDPSDPGNLPYCYQLMGHLDTLVEMSGGTNVKIELKEKIWEGASATVFNIQWE